MVDYVRHGIEPGSFLRAMLRNDLKTAVRNADDDNLAALRDYVGFMDGCIPSRCQGNETNYREWITRGGADGFLRQRCTSPDLHLAYWHECEEEADRRK